MHTQSTSLDSRRPIGIAMLPHLVHATKAVIADPYERRLVAAMFLLAFHGFLRIGEITIRPGVSPHHIIQYSDVEIAPDVFDHYVIMLQCWRTLFYTLSVCSAGSEDCHTNVTSLYNSASNTFLIVQSAQLGLRADKWNQSWCSDLFIALIVYRRCPVKTSYLHVQLIYFLKSHTIRYTCS